jgi:hypothetical protein
MTRYLMKVTHTLGSCRPRRAVFRRATRHRGRRREAVGLSCLLLVVSGRGQSAGPCRSAGPHTRRDAYPYRRRLPSLRSAVELRLSEKSRGFAKDLVGLSHSSRTSRSRSLIRARSSLVIPTRPVSTSGHMDPLAKRLCRSAYLSRDRANSRPLRVVLALVIENHPNRPFAYLWGIPDSLSHDSNPLKKRSLRQVRAIHRGILTTHSASAGPSEVRGFLLRCTYAPPSSLPAVDTWYHRAQSCPTKFLRRPPNALAT